MKTEKEKMLDGEIYFANDKVLVSERTFAKKLLHKLNVTEYLMNGNARNILPQLMPNAHKRLYIEPPFHCDYGYNIHVGENFYANYNLTILDVGKVSIGKNVMFAPHVSIYTAGHPLHPEMRNTGYEYGIEVTIGDNVWVGGNVVILPGVTIGNNVVIGSGSVVTKDLPENALAAGNPCRVLRLITEEDRKYNFRDRVFDEETLKELGLEL